jgi:hypothetical protein
MLTELTCFKSAREYWTNASRENRQACRPDIADCDRAHVLSEWKALQDYRRRERTVQGRSDWQDEEESVKVSAEEQAREARIERTGQRAKELMRDPEFVASLRSSGAAERVMSEEDTDILRRLNEGEFRREANIRLYGRDFDNPPNSRDGE